MCLIGSISFNTADLHLAYPFFACLDRVPTPSGEKQEWYGEPMSAATVHIPSSEYHSLQPNSSFMQR